MTRSSMSLAKRHRYRVGRKGFGLLWVRAEGLCEGARIAWRRKSEDAFLDPLALWAQAASGQALVNALSSASHEAVKHLLGCTLASRLDSAERQNAILEGGRHKAELDDAVAAATKTAATPHSAC